MVLIITPLQLTWLMNVNSYTFTTVHLDLLVFFILPTPSFIKNSFVLLLLIIFDLTYYKFTSSIHLPWLNVFVLICSPLRFPRNLRNNIFL